MARDLAENPDLPHAIPAVAGRVVGKPEVSAEGQLMVSAHVTDIVVHCEAVSPHRVPPVMERADQEAAGDVQVHPAWGLSTENLDTDVAGRPEFRRRIGTTQLSVEQPVGRNTEGIHG